MIDGVDHINIYSRGETELGRWMSNWARTPIETEDGHFESVEGYWAWLGSHDERCRAAVGHEAKRLISKTPEFLLPEREFKRKIKVAIIAKVCGDSEMAEELRRSSLPFKHYYVYNGRPVAAGHLWLVEFWEDLRAEL